MENKVEVFKNAQFGDVRIMLIGGEPWFAAADVCKALDIDRTQTRRLDEDEKGPLQNRLKKRSERTAYKGCPLAIFALELI